MSHLLDFYETIMVLYIIMTLNIPQKFTFSQQWKKSFHKMNVNK